MPHDIDDFLAVEAGRSWDKRVQPRHLNQYRTAFANTPTMDDVYAPTEVDALIEAQVAAINARPGGILMGSNRRYSCMTHGLGARSAVTGASVGAGDFRLQRLYFPEAKAFDAIGIDVTAFAVGGLMGIGRYLFNPATWEATLVEDFGEFDCSSNGEKTVPITETIGPGEVWLGTLPNATISVSVVSPAMALYQSTLSAIGALGRSAVSSSPMTMPATVAITAASTVTQLVWLETV